MARRARPARGESLAPVTIDAARILGIDGRIGSLEAGKDGDLAFSTATL